MSRTGRKDGLVLYNLTLQCSTAHHRSGARLYLWDMLPSRIDRLRLLRAELDDAQSTA